MAANLALNALVIAAAERFLDFRSEKSFRGRKTTAELVVRA
jgi:hypothetical protein